MTAQYIALCSLLLQIVRNVCIICYLTALPPEVYRCDVQLISKLQTQDKARGGNNGSNKKQVEQKKTCGQPWVSNPSP